MSVVLSEDRDKVLLLRREFFILWDLPGGEIEKDEDAIQAAVRETHEETGYDTEITGFTGHYVHESVYGRGNQLTYAFSARAVGGTPKPYGLESTGLRWFPVTALPRGLEPLHRQIIADALAGGQAVSRHIPFPRWKLYPARVVFFIVRWENYIMRMILQGIRGRLHSH